MVQINLIPSRRQDALRCRARLRYWIAGMIAYGILLGVCALTYQLGSTGGGHTLREQIAHVELEIEQSKLAVADLTSQIRLQQVSLRASQLAADQPDWSQLLGLLAKVRGDAVVLRDCQLQSASSKGSGSNEDYSADEFTLTIGGYGMTHADVSMYVLRLEQLGLFNQVTLAQSLREPFLSNHAIAFRLECQLGVSEEVVQ